MHEDAAVKATENAYRAIAAGEYRDEHRYRRDAPPEQKPAEKRPPIHHDTGQAMTAEQVRARWEGEAVGPLALAIACDHADVGAYCFPSCGGLCGPRVRAVVAARAGGRV
jgi:hypothetical protein